MKEDFGVQNIQYARYIQRVFASFIDGILEVVFIFGFIFLLILGVGLVAFFAGGSFRIELPFSADVVGVVISAPYFVFLFWNKVYLLSKKGGSLGKQAMSIEVISEENQEHIGIGRALLRETIGKFLSSLIFYVGFLMPLWDRRRQGLHDKVAGTIVIKK